MEWVELQTFGVVLMALIGVVLTIDKLLDVAKRRLNDPAKEESDWKKETNERLSRGDEHMKRQDAAIDILLKSQAKILQHMAYGNHVEDLKTQIQKIQDFLIEEREQ